MTVSTTATKITYSGNGSTTTFPFGFAFPAGLLPGQAATLLQITAISASGTTTVINFGPGLTQYQLAINAPVSPNPTSVGGVVTYNPGGTPLPVGSTLVIVRMLPDVQPVSLQNQGTLWQTVLEQALDYLAMVTQQISGIAGRFISAPATDPEGLNYTLP